MSTWNCGCDPEANHYCESPRCTYRRSLALESPRPSELFAAELVAEAGIGGTSFPSPQKLDITDAELVRGPGAANMAEACRLVNGPRQGDYGTPRQNYEGIAKVWSGILSNRLKSDITPEEAALMMVGLKLQRQAQKHKQDNLVDAHGYLLVYEHILNG
jgi:hypothetical protein